MKTFLKPITDQALRWNRLRRSEIFNYISHTSSRCWCLQAKKLMDNVSGVSGEYHRLFDGWRAMTLHRSRSAARLIGRSTPWCPPSSCSAVALLVSCLLTFLLILSSRCYFFLSIWPKYLSFLFWMSMSMCPCQKITHILPPFCPFWTPFSISQW